MGLIIYVGCELCVFYWTVLHNAYSDTYQRYIISLLPLTILYIGCTYRYHPKTMFVWLHKMVMSYISGELKFKHPARAQRLKVSVPSKLCSCACAHWV